MGRRLMLVLLILILLFAAGGYWFLSSDTPEPQLKGEFQQRQLSHDGYHRQYGVYLPASLADPAPLVILLHGSMGDGEEIRRQSQFGFDRLGDEQGFITAYPDGFEGHWNDCRKAARYSAREKNLDDLGFLQALVAELAEEGLADSQQVYLAGFSNGGHLAFRAAMESPDWVQAIAAISANLPARDNNDCTTGEQPMATLLINGTDDPINPYEGGQVTLFGFGDRGDVLPSYGTLAYFGDPGPGAITPLNPANARQQVQGQALIERWQGQDAPLLELVTLNGGGHTLPSRYGRMPRLLGTTNADIETADQVWGFFQAVAARSLPQPE
ncbi:MAG: polyhydroxybutyrate depolymerase [Halomonadaceae bacterium]|nr:MAG: polyhydroxybutyrate depolymerase [Halomonadaceae bacterium]